MRSSKLRKYLFSTENTVLFSGCVLFIIAGLLNIKTEKPVLELSKQDTALNINTNLLSFISAGNKRLLTDLLWVQTLIESDTEHYKNRDLNSWLFLRFLTISNMDPNFYQNYLYGGQFLAIIKDDLEGADFIYTKGLNHFPNDYDLNFNAGFLNYYEIGNAEKGLKYLSKVEKHSKAPPYIRSIINKLLLESGTSLAEVYELVKYNYDTTKDEYLKRRLFRDLYAIRAELDLDCLNKELNNCNLIDLEGNAYLNNSGKYEAPKKYVKYGIKRRKEVEE